MHDYVICRLISGLSRHLLVLFALMRQHYKERLLQSEILPKTEDTGTDVLLQS